MQSFFGYRGNQKSGPTSIDVTEYDESASEFSPDSDSDDKEESKEDQLKSGRTFSSVITTNATPAVTDTVTPEPKPKPRHRGRRKGRHRPRHKGKHGGKKRSWWSRAWGRGRSSRHMKSTKPHRKRMKGESTVSMRKHHHATFAHLIHDALLRLKCSPIHRTGYSHKQLTRNIERHYRLKLGKKFKVRLQLSLERLVEKALLVPVGKAKKVQKYKQSLAFLKRFSRLKVIDGAANRRYGVEIDKHHRHRHRRGRHSRRRGRSHRRRKRRRRRRRKGRERKRHHGRRRRRHGRSRRRRRHSRRRRRRHRHRRRGHSKKKSHSKKEASVGSSITNWLWPTADTRAEAEAKAQAEAKDKIDRIDGKQLLRKLRFVPRARKRLGKRRQKKPPRRGWLGRGKGARYRKFNRIRIRERKEKPMFPTPAFFSRQVSKRAPPDEQQGATEPQTEEYKTPPTSISDIPEEDDDMSETTSEKSMTEHDLLHSLKESSEGYPSRKSFLEKIGSTLWGAFGSKRTSTIVQCEEAGPSRSRPQKVSKGASTSQRGLEFKGPYTKASRTSSARRRPTSRRSSLIASSNGGGGGNGERAISPRDPQFPISPRLASLLQE
ncbi:unnamed protein product [Calypogeia fissa]